MRWELAPSRGRWYQVGYKYTSDGWRFVHAMDFIGGVLVILSFYDQPIYIPGFRIKFQSGDADCNTFERIE